jgi:hypothetical protein
MYCPLSLRERVGVRANEGPLLVIRPHPALSQREGEKAMPDVDFFNFFRWTLGTIVTIYATIITAQSLWGWWVWLAGDDKHMTMLRRYVLVHGLRLRFMTFWGDVIVCGLLCVVFLIMLRAHYRIADLGDALKSVAVVETKAK